MLREKPRQDLNRLRLLMVSLGHAIERKDVLVQLHTLNGHHAIALRQTAWLGQYIAWYEEVRTQVRAAADRAMAAYIDRLKRQIPFVPADSLDQETVVRSPQSAAKIRELLASMDAANTSIPVITVEET